MGISLGLGLNSGGVLFDPSAIAGFFARWTAGPSWCFSDAGTTPAGHGDAVYQANDRKSGNPNPISQTTLANRPVLTLESGLWRLRYAPTKYLVRTFAGPTTLSQPTTIFLVGKTAASTTDQGKFFDGDNNARRHLLDESTAWRIYAGSGPITGGTPDDNVHQFTALFNTTASTLRVDGTEVIAAGNAGNHTLTGITIGAAYNFATGLTGDVCDLLIYNAAVAAADVLKIEAHLKATWGTP